MFLRMTGCCLHLRLLRSPSDIYTRVKRCKRRSRRVYFEWGETGQEIEITNVHALLLVCHILSAFLDESGSRRFAFGKREAKLEVTMQSLDDNYVTTDEDMTDHDMYTMGYHH